MSTSKISEQTWGKIQEYIDSGYINAIRHSKLPITIYKYSRLAETNRFWPKEIRMCRGLVLDDNRNIVILPPPKFFNYDEPQSVEIEAHDDWECLEKLDGYYIAIKRDSRYGVIVTSSGSFENKYTEAAERFFDQRTLVPGVSYFCELCQNFKEDSGIIVANHETPQLICWGARPTLTGKELDVLRVSTKPFQSVRSIPRERVKEYLKEKVEGVVLYSPSSGDRIKIKTQWWFDVHAQIGFCTLRRIFTMMRSGVEIDFDKSCVWYTYADKKHQIPHYWDGPRLPDELRPVVQKWAAEIQDAVAAVELKAQDYFSIWSFESDAQIANNLSIPKTYRSIILSKRKGKNYDRILWDAAERRLFPKES